VAKDIFINGGRIRIAPETFIENKITKQRYKLVNAENIHFVTKYKKIDALNKAPIST
jgi:hypothetical protein